MSAELNQTIETLRTHRTDFQSVLCRFSPVPKVLFTFGFLILTVSIGRYDFFAAAAFALIPYFLAWVGGVSPLRLLRFGILALPLVLCAGVGNCFFDTKPVADLFGHAISGGQVSLFVLSAKTFATVGMALLLSTTTPINQIASALTRLRVPCLFVLQIQLLFRYLLLTLEEAQSVLNAYALRNPDQKLIPIREWGPLVGQLFVRTVRRGNSVYLAMQCRLFSARNPLPAARHAALWQWLTVWGLLAFLIFVRLECP